MDATFMTELPEEFTAGRTRNRAPSLKPKDLLQDGQKVLFRYMKVDYLATYETTRGLVYGERVFDSFHDFIGILTIESGKCRPYVQDGRERKPKELVGNLWNRIKVEISEHHWVKLANIREAELSRRNFTYHHTPTSPATPTETPATPTETPATPTETPATPTETPTTPTETTETPVETTETPTETTETHVETTETPTETTETPTETTETPTEPPETPTEPPETPTETTETPVETTETPTETVEGTKERKKIRITVKTNSVTNMVAKMEKKLEQLEKKLERSEKEKERLRERNMELEQGMSLIAGFATKKIKVKISKKQ
jgi:hypothetical protein